MLELDVMNSIEQHFVEKAWQNQIPISGTFELLPLCNMNCKMCYVRMSPEEMKKEGTLKTGKEWLALAREAVESGCLFLLLTGGEPLLHPDFKEIYMGLLELGIYITINTNGTLIDEEMADFFAKNMPRRVNITLYGSNEKIYENLCQNGEAFQKTMKAIQLLKQRNVPVKLNNIPTKLSISDTKNVMELAKKLELPIDIPYYIFPQARKVKKEEPERFRLSPEEAAKLRMDLVKYDFLNDKQGYENSLREALQSIDAFDSHSVLEKQRGFWCLAGRNSFWINWKGTMNSCGMLEYSKINAFEKPFKDNWKELLAITGAVQLSDECFACKYRVVCSPCAASMFTEGGAFHEVPKYRCETMKIYESLLRDEIKEIME